MVSPRILMDNLTSITVDVTTNEFSGQWKPMPAHGWNFIHKRLQELVRYSQPLRMGKFIIFD